MKKLLLLIVSAGAMSACGSTVTEEQVNEVLSQSGTYAPTYDDGVTDMGDMVSSDTVGDGISGHMGLADGTVRPVRIRLSDDEATAYISVDGAPELAFGIRTQGRQGSDRGTWSDGENSIIINYGSNSENYFSYANDDGFARGYFGMQTDPNDLPETVANYAGFTYIEGDISDATINIIAQADFAGNAITGFVTGEFFDGSPREAADPFFAGGLTGEISESQVGMVANVTGADVSGTIEMLGAFYDDADVIAGGIGATLNGQTMGGEFSLSEGIYGDF